jgi:hypothetical protein
MIYSYNEREHNESFTDQTYNNLALRKSKDCCYILVFSFYINTDMKTFSQYISEEWTPVSRMSDIDYHGRGSWEYEFEVGSNRYSYLAKYELMDYKLIWSLNRQWALGIRFAAVGGLGPKAEDGLKNNELLQIMTEVLNGAWSILDAYKDYDFKSEYADADLHGIEVKMKMTDWLYYAPATDKLENIYQLFVRRNKKRIKDKAKTEGGYLIQVYL